MLWRGAETKVVTSIATTKIKKAGTVEEAFKVIAAADQSPAAP